MTNLLSNQKIQSIYSNNKDIEKFYATVLSCAKTYKRVSAYISPEIFNSLSNGIKEFVNNDGYMQLVISNQIDKETLNLIKEGYVKKESAKFDKNKYNSFLYELFKSPEKDIFLYMIAIGKLDIRIAFKISGIFHDKFCIISDGLNELSYIGSNNTTINGVHLNDEAFQVTIDWDNPSSRELKVISDLNQLFSKIWENEKEDVLTLKIDDPILDDLFNSIDYEKIKKYKENPDFICLDVNDKNIVSLNSNLKLKEILNYKNIGDYSDEYFLSFSKSGATFNNIERCNEIVELKKLIKLYCSQNNISFYLTSKANRYFSLNEKDYQKLALIGNNIKDNSFLEKDDFYYYKNKINSCIKRPLKDKQIQASTHIIEMEKSLNFSVPGSGKTATVLGAFEYLSSLPKNNIKHVDKILVIGPINCAKSWRDEYDAVSNFSSAKKPLCLINGDSVNDKVDVLEHDFKTSRVIIINYELLPKLSQSLENLIDENVFVVLDEIHRIKKIDSKKCECLRKILKFNRFCVALTGTPFPNGYIDLYNMMLILHNDYTYSYFDMFEMGLKKYDSRYRKTGLQYDELNKKLYPFYIRVNKDDLNIPLPEADHLIHVMANSKEQFLYNQIISAKSLSFENTIKLVEIGCVPFKVNNEELDLDYLNKNPEKFLTSKIARFLEEIKRNRRKSVVWCVFVDTINVVKYFLEKEGYKVKCIYGETPQDERDSIIDEFNCGDLEIIVTNPATLAESVSLHKACHDAHYLELNYNLYQYLQSRDRIHRLGIKDTDKTNYYLYLNYYDGKIDKSCDFTIYKALQRKEKLMKSTIDRGNFVFGDDVSVEWE